MSYSPHNATVYLRAFAGFMAGITGAVSNDTDESAFANYALMGDAYSQQGDTAWGAAAPTQFELATIEAASESVWETRSPLTVDANVPSAYTTIAASIVARVRQANDQVVSEGIDPNAGSAAGPFSFTDTTTSIKSLRSAHQGAIAAGLNGASQYGSDTSGTALGVTADYASVLGGDQNSATGTYAVVVGGVQNTASGIASYAEGDQNTASGGTAHAEGAVTVASGSLGAHAEGNATLASGDSSHAEGNGTSAQGFAAHAEGQNTTAFGVGSHAEGASSAFGPNCHAEGHSTAGYVNDAHAEGTGSQAQGDSAHAEGALTTASGVASHAEGASTQAVGDRSHAEGSSCVAYGSGAHAEGIGSIALRDGQHALAGGNAGDTSLTVAQTSEMHFFGFTPGSLPNETSDLVYRDTGGGGHYFTPEDGKAYTIRAELIVRTTTGGVACRSLVRTASVRKDGGVVTVTGQNVTDSFGDAALAANTLSFIQSSPDLLIQFTTGAATTAQCSVSARVVFTEVHTS
jgi:hypothetical protein